MSRYEAAKLAGSACGGEAWRAFQNVVIAGQAPTSAEKPLVKKVCAALHKYRELGRRAAQRSRRGTTLRV